jgi:hypothetical protein
MKLHMHIFGARHVVRARPFGALAPPTKTFYIDYTIQANIHKLLRSTDYMGHLKQQDIIELIPSLTLL